MIVRKFVLFFTSLFALSSFAGPVYAQMWVSSNGVDNNTCTQAAPCATFQKAINNGATQINCLSSGSYGQIAITTSLTIDCGTGNVGNVLVPNGFTGIAISGSAITVVLRHLAINSNGTGTGGGGILTTGSTFSGTLIIEDCMIQGVATGIGFIPNGRGQLQVSNTQIFKNGTGVLVSPFIGQIASVTFSQVELVANSQDGLDLGGGVVAGTIRNSIVGENVMNGISSSADQAYFTVEQSSIVDNLQNGIKTITPGSSIKVAASTIGGNGTGVLAVAGAIVSFGDNHVADNASDGNFTGTKALK